MTLTVKGDPARPGGGYAILTLESPARADRLAFEDRSSGLFLADGGGWGRQPHYLSVETAKPGSVRIGPEVVDHIEADMPIAVHAPGDGVVGTLVWPPLRPSASTGDGNMVAVAPTASAIEYRPSTPVSPASPAVANGGPAAPATPEPSEEAAAATPAAAKRLPEVVPTATPGRRGLFRWTALALLLASIALLAWVAASTDMKERVCEAGRAFPSLFNTAGFACPISAREDQEPGAYADFAQCTESRPACQQDSCAETYLRAAPTGTRGNIVRQKRAEALAACDRDRTRDADFAAFKACIEATPEPCARRDCVKRFRARLDVDPFTSSLRVILETADQACANAQAETAYAAFNGCLARSAECDRDACASGLPANVRNGAHAADIARALQTGRDSCADARSVAEFNQCFSRADACERARCGERLTTRDWAGPHGGEFRTTLEGARDMCADEAAYAEFARCAASTDSCSRADCAANLPARVRSGPHAGDVAAALNAAQRDCTAQQPGIMIRPSFDCARATHNAEYAICSDPNLAQLDLALASAYNARLIMLSGEAQRQLVRSEDRWVGYRNATCDSSSVDMAKRCLIPIFESRIAELRGY